MYKKIYYELPESLQKVIYEDNLEEFQSITSAVTFSYDDRILCFIMWPSAPKERIIFPIHLAAFYGSIRIFKYIFIQQDIYINKELFEYSLSGGNIEIIRLIEAKFHFNREKLYAGYYNNEIYNWLLDVYEVELDIGSLIENNNIEILSNIKNLTNVEQNFEIALLNNSFASAIYLIEFSSYDFTELHYVKDALTKNDMLDFFKIIIDTRHFASFIDIKTMIKSYSIDIFNYNLNNVNRSYLIIEHLNYSIRLNRNEFALKLLDHFILDLNHDYKDENPIVVAFDNQNSEIFKILLERTKSIEPIVKYYKNRSLTIYEKATTFDSDAFDLLNCIKHIKKKNNDGYYLVHYAAMSGALNNMKKIVEKEHKMINCVYKKNNSTPLIMAVASNHIEVDKYLLSFADIKINVKDSSNSQAIHYAAQTGDESIIEKLLSFKNIMINVPDKYGRTPFSYACAWSSRKIIELFINRGAYINAIDKKGNSPLFYAIYYQHFNIDEIFPSKCCRSCK